MGGVKYHFSLSLLLTPALFSLPLAADTSAPVAPSVAEAAAPLAVRLRAVLDEIERNNTPNFYEAANLVLQETGDPTAFQPLMEEAAKAGSAAAAAALGTVELNRLRSEGVSLASDPRAVALRARMLAAGQKGYFPALAQAAFYMAQGIGGPKDEAAAARCLMPACKKGDMQARAGYLVFSGRLEKGGIKDPAVAAELARNNYYLEEIIAQSLGDTPEGVYWLRRAMEHGSSRAPFVLLRSEAAAHTEQELTKCLLSAAERHNPDAMAFLGGVKLFADRLPAGTGLLVQKDVEGGMQLLRLAASMASPEAATSLAVALLSGQVGECSAQQICALFRMAAELGDAQGMAGYGYCLLTGRGCEPNPALGQELVLSSIEKGASFGNRVLASACFNGYGMKPDLRRAISALGEDASMGVAQSYAVMAGLVALGNEGSPPDPFRARIYLDMALEEEGAAAQAVYDEILRNKGWREFPRLWEE